MPSFELTARQREANQVLASDAPHVLLYGGSRSGKTFLILRAIVIRALKAARSRHAVLRHRFAHVRASVVLDTFPRVMELCFPERRYRVDKSSWFAELADTGSQIWFGGLDDKERVEKVLGQEHASIFLNECSQISWHSRNVALTRLAQSCSYELAGERHALKRKMYYDCNPPGAAHWTHRIFIEKRDPETRQPLSDPGAYVALRMNPVDNEANLPEGYIDTLRSLPARMRRRFLEGEFAEATPGQLFTPETIDKWRVTDGRLPDLQRVVIGVDPSGAGDEDNAGNDEIGIGVAALGTDGNAYVLEDLTVLAGPAVWGRVAATAYERHAADVIVGETNFGGAMVGYVIKAAAPNATFREVTASRGKVVRAEPIAALYEQGKVRHVGHLHELEDELAAFTTSGYLGEGSPNRADAVIWALSELFPGIVRDRGTDEWKPHAAQGLSASGWMTA